MLNNPLKMHSLRYMVHPAYESGEFRGTIPTAAAEGIVKCIGRFETRETIAEENRASEAIKEIKPLESAVLIVPGPSRRQILDSSSVTSALPLLVTANTQCRLYTVTSNLPPRTLHNFQKHFLLPVVLVRLEWGGFNKLQYHRTKARLW